MSLLKTHGACDLFPGIDRPLSGSFGQMAIIGRLHPLLIHFPIALVVIAVVAETRATVTRDERWHTMAVGNLRAGAVFALIAVVAGWRLASGLGMGSTPLLEWHRWLGTLAAVLTLLVAVTTSLADSGSAVERWVYRIALLGAGALVAVTGHLGALLVWGADFLRP
jgi:uncharacterized membrane protein